MPNKKEESGSDSDSDGEVETAGISSSKIIALEEEKAEKEAGGGKVVGSEGRIKL